MATNKEGQTKDKDNPLEMTDEELNDFFQNELAKIPTSEEPALEADADETGGEPAGKDDTTPSAPEGEPTEKEPTEDATAKLTELVPEQFRSKDFAESLSNMTKEWGDMQSRLSKREQEISRLQKAMRAAQQARPSPAQRQSTQPAQSDMRNVVPAYGAPDPNYIAQELAARPDPIEEPEAYQQWMDGRYLGMGQQMLYDFANNLQRVWDSNSNVQMQKQLANYDKKRQLADEFTRFRGSKEDFDHYRDDMVRVLEEHPYLNEQLGAVETVYEMARERNAQRMGHLRQEVQPEGYSDTRKAIVVLGKEIQKINERAAAEKTKTAKEIASGTGGSSGTVRTKDRLNPTREQFTSEEDKMWDTIINSQLGGETNEGDSAAIDLLNLERFAKPLVKGEL